jgi:glycosyltransferase involved in cell wall biosynthesis
MVVVPTLARGGAEKVARVLANQFAHAGKSVVVVTYNRDPARNREFDLAPEVVCEHLSVPGSGFSRVFRLVWILHRVIRRRRPRAILTVLTHANVIGVVAGAMSRTGVPVVATEHNTFPPGEAACRSWADLAKASLISAVYRRSRAVVAVSPAVAGDLYAARWFRSSTRVHVIPNPVDIASVRTLATSTPAIGPLRDASRRLVVCVGRLDTQKNHAVLLRALALLPDHELVLIGDGPSRPLIERTIADLDLETRVTLCGELANPFPILAAADVVVLASAWEGFGLVAVEAAALGRPFVGTAVPGLQDVCETLGQVTVPPGDHRALAAAIQSTQATPPNESALATFSPAVIAQQYLDLLAGPSEP